MQDRRANLGGTTGGTGSRRRSLAARATPAKPWHPPFPTFDGVAIRN